PAGAFHRRGRGRRQYRNLRGRGLCRRDRREEVMAEEIKTAADDDVSWAELKAPLIRLSLELGPLIVFFAVNSFGERWLEASPLLSSWFSQPIIFATAVFMVAMAISLLLSWLLLKRVAVMPLVTGVVVLVFGTLTLVFQDATFIKMKPTIVNSL